MRDRDMSLCSPEHLCGGFHYFLAVLCLLEVLLHLCAVVLSNFIQKGAEIWSQL